MTIALFRPLPRRRSSLSLRLLACGAFIGFAACVSMAFSAETSAPSEGEAESAPAFLRITEERGEWLALEVASRVYAPADEGDGPRIGLIAVAHIGDRAFYNRIADALEAYDVVLYEGIRPSGVAGARGETDAEKVDSTRRALHFVGGALEAFREANGRYPKDLDDLKAFAGTLDPVIVNWLDAATIDAWGRPLRYEPKTIDGEPNRGFTLRSASERARPVGPPEDGDLVITHESDIDPIEVDSNPLQKQLAETLNLAFQLEALPYDRSNWRASDITMEDLVRAFREQGVDMGPVEAMAGQSPLPERLMRLVLRIVSMLDAASEGAVSDMMKIMLIEMLGEEEILQAGMQQFGPGFAEVIIERRNAIVMNDIERILNDEPDVETIAVLYGAAHMDDFHASLTDALDYEPVDRDWLPAIRVDIEDSPITPAQAEHMRRTLREMIERELGR